MTEIGKIASSTQVADLRATQAANPASGTIDRLAGKTALQSGQSTEAKAAPAEAGNNGNATPLERAAEALQSFLPEKEQAPNTRLRIDKDDETGRFVYQNVDTESGEVIKQFPPESILEFLSYYREVAGLAVDDKA